MGKVEMKISIAEAKKHIEAAGKAYGVAYVLMTTAMDYIDTGDIHLRKTGLLKHSVKREASRVQGAFDAFCRSFKPMIGHGDSKIILNDYETLKAGVEKLINE